MYDTPMTWPGCRIALVRADVKPAEEPCPFCDDMKPVGAEQCAGCDANDAQQEQPLTNHERIELYELRHAVNAQQEQPAYSQLLAALHKIANAENISSTSERYAWQLQKWAEDALAGLPNAQQEQPTAEAVREAAARVAEAGSFLHADSPAAKFGRECAAAIRRMPLPVSDAQQAQPAGYVLVPETPTQEMCIAGQEKAREWPSFPLRISPIYQAMLAAAPKPSQL